MSSAKHSVLFVCLGNICRSPMAEVVFLATIAERGLSSFFRVDSAATSRYEIGNAPDSRSMAVCKEKLGSKMPAYRHRARQVTADDFRSFDYILCMDKSNLADLQEMAPPGATAAVKLLGSFDPQGHTIIEDPYYGGRSGFEKNFDQVTRSVDGFLRHLGYPASAAGLA